MTEIPIWNHEFTDMANKLDQLVNVKVAGFTFSILPEEHPAHRHLSVAVEWRGAGRWAVKWAECVLNRGGLWNYEPHVTERSAEWIRDHRFTLTEASQLAREQATKVTLNGKTAQEILNEGNTKQ